MRRVTSPRRPTISSCRRPPRLALALALAAAGAIGGSGLGCRGPAAATDPAGEHEPASSPPVLLRAHAHNDYEHPRPLLDALDRGFMSVEADVHLVGGELLVAHDRDEVVPGRTLERLYLDPLRARWARHGGRILPGQPPDRPFLLLVDVKSAPRATYEAVHAALAAHEPMLTVVRDGAARRGAVQVVISGGRPIELMRRQRVRYAGVDGRLPDLDSDEPPHFMPLISASWWDAFFWLGDGPMPPPQRERLEAIVAKAHERGRRVRFWATPERPEVWRLLLDAGVDLLNTDRLDAMRDFLLETDESGG